MKILSREEAQQLLKKVLSYSRAEGCEVNLSGSAQGNLRYARNTATTAGSVSDQNLVISSNYGLKQGTATINEFDETSLQKVVRRSENLAKLAPENPEFMPNLGPQKYEEVNAYFESTAGITPQYRAQAAAHSIEPSRKKDLVAAGFFDDQHGFQAMANSNGLFAYHKSSECNFSVTVRTSDGTGSGYAIRDFNDVDLLDTGKASQIAIQKAESSRNAKAIEPGKYTVILEPAASSGLLQNMLFNFAARRADEGRSFLSKKDGGTRKGEKLFGEEVTLYSDPQHPLVPVSPWSGDGQRRERVVWIEKGVVKNLFYSRYWAKKMETEPIPFPANGIMEGGDASLEDLIKDTKSGILITRTWYIRTVDPQTLLYTGLTRDGNFLIKNGKISHPVKNMRFNESPVKMLNNIEALGRPVRINGNLIPPMRVREFEFTSGSDAV